MLSQESKLSGPQRVIWCPNKRTIKIPGITGKGEEERSEMRGTLAEGFATEP